MKKAFTLAEVLITLSIIGVVAALTMPSLIQNYRKQQTVTGLKKAYTIVNQAMKLSELDNGPYSSWEDGATMDPNTYNEKYWLPYFKTVRVCNTYQECGYDKERPFKNLNGEYTATYVTYSGYRIPFIVNDGILYSFSLKAGEGRLDDGVYIDINGAKGPNQFGHDVFTFTRTDKGIVPYGYQLELTPEEIDEGCSKSGENEHWTCAARIMRDGWKISKDYPW